ncbi:MAG: 2OG-Fe(II) oxygenase [Rhizobiaceae bacterium]|nr:2OG-Fe(II) oxygenase [Rhizobiaceae bacterium]
MARYRLLEAGDPAPWFTQASTSNPAFHFDTAGGRYIVLCLFGTAGDAHGQAMLSIVDEHRALFDDQRLSFFGVSFDPADQASGRVAESLPGVRHFWDFDGTIGRLYGAVDVDAAGGASAIRRQWIVLDPSLRVLKVVAAAPDAAERTEVAAYLATLPPVGDAAGFSVQAPIIVLPNVFEPELCQELIALYDAHGGTESGFMREVDGKTVAVSDHRHKRRADYLITDEALVGRLQARFRRRVIPEIRKVHQFEVTRMERYIVACYDSKDGGHFGAHRDNTTKGTAHRRFAASINLNGEFEGGEVWFPEYGRRSFKPPPGGAVVFSCSLLHAVTPVTTGRRFAFLPFLYDDAAAKIREANNQFLDASVGKYKSRPGGG